MAGRKIIRFALLAALAIGVLLLCSYFFLKSSFFHDYALRKIEDSAHESTGARTRIGSFRLDLAPLTVRLDDVNLHGTEPDGARPLLHVDKLVVGIRIHSLFAHNRFSLRELIVEHPVANVEVNSDGHSNIPQAAPSKGPSTSIFDLAIGHFELDRGEIYYNNRQTPLSADVYDLQSTMKFDAGAYVGTLSYSNGHLAYAGYAPLEHSFRADFAASPSTLSLRSAEMKIASSAISLKAEVANFADPTVDGSYDVILHTQDFGALSPAAKPAGDVHIAGTAHYQNKNNQSFLRGLTAQGSIESNGVGVSTAQVNAEARAVSARYALANAELNLNQVEAETFGGRIRGEAKVQNVDATPSGTVRAQLHEISLRTIQDSVKAKKKSVGVSGTLGGSIDAAWAGRLANIRAHSDLTIRGGAKYVSSESTTVPVDAIIHAGYDGSSGALTLRQSSFHAASLSISADGEVSQRSNLKINAQGSDLHQLALLAASFGMEQAANTPLSGSATLQATVRGSLRQPQVSGQLNVTDLQLQGTAWKNASTSFAASSSGVSVTNGVLNGEDHERAAFSGRLGLRDWGYSPDSPIQTKISAQHISISDLQHLAGTQYPIEGELSANISLSGSQNHPSGSGSLDVSGAKAYGETIRTLDVKFQGAHDSITATLNAAADAGAVATNLTYDLHTKSYKFSANAPGIALQKIHTLQLHEPMKGTLTVSARGEGTLDNPQLTASVEIPQLDVHQQSLAELKATLQVADRQADFDFDSKVLQIPVHARARVALTGEYQADASIDTGTIPLGALAASFSPGTPKEFQGQAELHATLKGPLKDKTQVEAHLTIPTLTASYRELQIGSASPIRADYAKSVLTLQPAEIKGSGTSLRVQGSIPLAGSMKPTMTAQGTLDMQVLRIFVPNVHSSGMIALDVHATGSPQSPEIAGQVQIQNVAVTTAASPLGMEKLNGTLDIAGDRVQISKMSAQIGGGQVSLGGAITYRPELQATLALQGKSIRLRYPAGLRTVLDGNLALNGNLHASSLNGRVLIDSLSFTPDFDLSTFADQFTNSVATPPQPGIADTVALGVSVQSKENLSATSSQVSVEGSANLNVNGTVANPVITGRTELTSGELFYRGNRYQLQRGIITFSDPNETNPNLNVSVSSTVEQYNLTINLRGTLDRMTTTYSSDPPLATADVIHLIAFGNTSSESAANSASQSTDAMVASSAIGTGLTSGIQKLAGFSSLQINPLLGGSNQNPSARIALQQRVTKNFLFTFSTDVSQPGQELVQGDYQINKRWSVSVTRDQVGGITVDGRLHTKF